MIPGRFFDGAAAAAACRGNPSFRNGTMSADSDSERRQRLRDELAQLREAALADLERRGYAVRGKTPAQIRELLRQRPKTHT